MKPHKPLRSLKSKALQLLAQREQSRVELRRKLTAHALAEVHALAETNARTEEEAWACGGEPAAGSAPERCRSAEEPSAPAASRVDEVLAWLDAHRFQSDARFAESRIHARAGRYGDLRIRQELKQHGVALDADAARALGETESSRAWAVWERRFGTPPATRVDTARQSRFLTARGFSLDTVRQVLRRARASRTDAETPLDDD